MKASQKWRIDQGRRTISPMINRDEFFKAFVVSILVALMTLIPYGIASVQAKPEGTFSGFLINPIDGFSYLAKMRQGYEGHWSFHLPYSVEPGEGASIFVYFLFLGHLSKWIGIPSIYLYHLVRFLGSVAMFSLTFLLLANFLKSKIHRWGAFSIILIGAGFGWMGVPFGILASDLWIVESIPFLSAYANSHFPLTTALFISLILLLFLEIKPKWLRVGAALVLSTLLAAIQPFSMIPLFVFLFLWLGLETWIEVKEMRGPIWRSEIGERWLVFFSLILGAIPWFIYDYWLTINHPEIAAWNTQNITPSPPIYEYILGFGGLFVLAFLGIAKGYFRNKKTDRLLLIWVISQGLLLYAPFGLQRRLSLGLFLGLVILAVKTLAELTTNQSKFRSALLILVVLSIPSNLLVVGSGLAGVLRMEPAVVLGKGEMDAYQWLTSNTDPGEIILAGPTAGNRIPAFANLRVFYGHPFETIDAENQKAFVEGAFSSEGITDQSLGDFLGLGISYVFYGPEEKELGNPKWLKDQELIYSSGEYFIYEISHP